MMFDDVEAIALKWPGVETGTSYGTPALKVRKKLLARIAAAPATGRAALEAKVQRTYSPFHRPPANPPQPPVT